MASPPLFTKKKMFALTLFVKRWSSFQARDVIHGDASTVTAAITTIGRDRISLHSNEAERDQERCAMLSRLFQSRSVIDETKENFV